MSEGKRFASSADDILSADDLDILELEVPEWHTTLRLRVLTANDQKKFAIDAKDDNKKYEATVRALVRCAVNEAGDLIFNESHIAGLMKKSLRVLNRIQIAMWQHNGIGEVQKALADAKND